MLMMLAPVGAAEGCDLLILLFKKIQIKRSQPAAAPTGIGLEGVISGDEE
jgi:hypothetical protein